MPPSSDLGGARAACREVLAFDEMHAEAHYLLGLCDEGLGELGAAVEQYELAAHLDARFAMPRLRLGVLARKRGELVGARRYLRGAIELLAKEREARVSMFGGGFARDALTTLCRAELSACDREER